MPRDRTPNAICSPSKRARPDVRRKETIHVQGHTHTRLRRPRSNAVDDVPTPEPGPAEALVSHTAVGLNYIDVYFRTGLYKAGPPCDARDGGCGRGSCHRVGRAWHRGGRPGCLRHRSDRRLCDRSGDIGRPPGQTYRRHRRPNGGGNDAARNDRPVPTTPHALRCCGRDDFGACCRRRCRSDPLPVGEAPGRHRHRRSLDRGKGRVGPAARGHTRHHRPRSPRRGGEAADRRQDGPRGLRQRWQGHVRCQP